MGPSNAAYECGIFSRDDGGHDSREPVCAGRRHSRSAWARAMISRRRRPRSAARSLVVAMLGLAAVATAGCEYFSKSKAHTAPPAPPPPLVQVVEVKPQTVKLQSEWVAQTYSQDAVEVRARV